jgi:hypothetical protein
MRAQALFFLSTDAHGLPLAPRVVERHERLFWPTESAKSLLPQSHSLSGVYPGVRGPIYLGAQA